MKDDGESRIQSLSKLNFAVTITVPAKQVISLLCCAFEGGSHYWARNAHIDYGPWDYANLKQFRSELGEEDTPMRYIAPLIGGAATIIEEYDDNDGSTIAVHRIDLAAIQRGLQLMATGDSKKIPRLYLIDVIDENMDVNTGDVFLQLAVLGELRYG